MSKKIFISYRRDDSRYQARGLHAALQQSLSRENVFMDIDSIPPGADFVEVLQGWVEQCDVLLALIGPDWIRTTSSENGLRRLDNPDDFVRIEITAALARGIPVVPVLLDGAAMPKPDQLPADMKSLSRRQAEHVDFRTFDTDIARLTGKLGLGPPVARGTEQAPPQTLPSMPSQAPSSSPQVAQLPLHCPATKRFLLSAHANCELLIQAEGIKFTDHKDGEYSFFISASQLLGATIKKKITREILITLRNGQSYDVGLLPPYLDLAHDRLALMAKGH